MAEWLVEILSEEIPARMQCRAASELAQRLTQGLADAGVEVTEAQSFSGPRRLVFCAHLPLKSADVDKLRKGPRLGAPESALQGFLQASGLQHIDEAEIIRDPKKGDYYAVRLQRVGIPTRQIIQTLLPEVMQHFPWPKSMRSGDSDFRWIRPVQSILCILDGKVVDVCVGGVQSGDKTYGHRHMSNITSFTVSCFADYQTQLQDMGYVLLSAQDRKTSIFEQAQQLCAAEGLEWVEDAALLDEVSGLVEWPVIILGDMKPEFLQLPSEVIRLSMRNHQKYFAVRDLQTGQLAPHFLIVANLQAADGGQRIKRGNEQVLAARLSDAQFFQSEDAKHRLESRYNMLSQLIYHKKLGSMRDKAERISKLAEVLAEILNVDTDQAVQAARLIKCDLLTHMVSEFPSLQGQIGGFAYEREGGDRVISKAIEEHYKPQGMADSVPQAPLSIVMALSDKMDTLAAFWAIDEKPTGSKDPFALRRTALGVVRTVLENQLRLPLEKTFAQCFSSLALQDIPTPSGAPEDVQAFIFERLKVYLRAQGVAHDVIDAIDAGDCDDVVDFVRRVEAVQAFLDTDLNHDLLAAYRRIANILKIETLGECAMNALPDWPEHAQAQALYTTLMPTRELIREALVAENYAQALTEFAQLRTPIDQFFDHVIVNDANEAVRLNNLHLLALIRDMAHDIADFDQIKNVRNME